MTRSLMVSVRMTMRHSQSRKTLPVLFGKMMLGVGAAAAISMSGCLVGPDHIDPGAPFACDWIDQLPPGVVRGPNESVAWWTKFNDPVLTSLIIRTTEQNLTLGQAAERIQEARATRGIVRGDLFPNIAGIGSYTRRETSNNGNAFGIPLDTPAFNYWQAGFDSTWEIDIFGSVRRRIQAADRDIDAAIEEHNDLLVTLQGDVGANYIQVRTLQRRIQFVERNIELQRQSLQITEDRLAAGTISQLDVEQAKSNLYTTEATLPVLHQELELAYHRLSILMGEPPSDLATEITPEQRFPILPRDISIGLPIDLIRQRPDIRSAERQLAAQAARIGVAVAELYPRFTLNGTFTVDATEISEWFTTDSIAYAFGPAMRWRLLDFGRVRSDIEVQRSRWRGLVYNYQQEVITSAQEVEDSLSRYRHSIRQAQALRQAALAARAAAEISEEQYRGGIIPFQTLLDAQRVQAELDDQTANAEGNIYLAVVQLYKALGGGWIEPFAVADPRPPVPRADGGPAVPGQEGRADGERLEPAELLPAPDPINEAAQPRGAARREN